MRKNQLKSALLVVLALVASNLAFSQNGVAIAASTSTADVSAMLDIQSTTKGALVPRMTNSQRAAITTPANGLLVFCTDAPSGFYYNSGTSVSPVWVLLSAGALSGTGTTNFAAKWTGSNSLGNSIIFDNGTNVGIGTSGTPGALLSVGGSTGNFQVNSTGAIGSATGITSSGTITFSGLGATAGVVLNSSSGVLSSSAGPLGVANGGTGATSAAAALTSLGAAPASGSANYIQNTTSQQSSSNFNISGTGIIGGSLGMAIASPAYKITFNNDGSGLGWSNSGYSRIFDNGDLHIQTDDNMWFDGITGNNVLYLATTGTYSGRVGIGTSTPANALDVRGNMDVSGLAGTGTRFVYADASGNLTAGNNSPNLAYVVDRTQRTNGAKIQASVSNATNNLAVVSGDIVTISATFKFAWNGGSGTDQPIFGINVTGCATATLTDSYQVGDADDIARSQFQVMSMQYVYTATCTGNLQFALYADTKTNADDGCFTSDVVIIARKY